LLIHVSGECSDNRATEEDLFKQLKYVADALNRLFDILFSCEGLVVKDISISVTRRKTLQSFIFSIESSLVDFFIVAFFSQASKLSRLLQNILAC
jgi:hypothetical protein